MLTEIRSSLRNYADPSRIEGLARFFKQKDRFIGVTVPEIRKVAKRFAHLPLKNAIELLHSQIHEERHLVLIIWVHQCKKMPEEIYQSYVDHIDCINNWDLVDVSAPTIVGGYLEHRDKDCLDQWVESESLWVRRIAIVATYWFIKHESFSETFRLSEKLLSDPEDLMHKAMGWMLREVGKRDQEALEHFLQKHLSNLPRTTLRYAIERFEESKRKSYLTMK